MNLSDVETGCYIDGSHRSTVEFMCLVIEMAHDYGFELEWEQFVTDSRRLLDDQDAMDVEELDEILDALDWTYEDALGYLNNNTRDGFYWDVEDQSLYLVEDADASQ